MTDLTVQIIVISMILGLITGAMVMLESSVLNWLNKPSKHESTDKYADISRALMRKESKDLLKEVIAEVMAEKEKEIPVSDHPHWSKQEKGIIEKVIDRNQL